MGVPFYVQNWQILRSHGKVQRSFAMSHLSLLPQKVHFIRDVYQDFILSRQAKLCSPATIEFYTYTAGKFVEWLFERRVDDPSEIKANHIRAYLSDLRQRKLADKTLHAHAGSIRTFLRFCYEEDYINKRIQVNMPKLSKKRLPVLTAEELHKVIKTSKTVRDKALVLLMADTGLRRGETLALTWGDIDIGSGLVRVRQGKGSKDRSVVVGVKTRRVLLKYRRTVPHDLRDPVFHLKASGLRMALKRIGERAGIKLNAHILRRTFATLSLRAGINPLHLQALMGHSSLEMTRRYIKLVDDDLLKAHKQHGPVDRFIS
jgi:site-specific recombinase XerD